MFEVSLIFIIEVHPSVDTSHSLIYLLSSLVDIFLVLNCININRWKKVWGNSLATPSTSKLATLRLVKPFGKVQYFTFRRLLIRPTLLYHTTGIPHCQDLWPLERGINRSVSSIEVFCELFRDIYSTLRYEELADAI